MGEVTMRAPLTTIALIVLFASVSVAARLPAAQTTARASPSVQTITVTLTDTAIIASQRMARPGIRYHFIVTNRGTVPHEFWLMPANMAQMMNQMPMSQWESKILYSTPDIWPGNMDAFDYTFASAMMRQSLAYGSPTDDGQSVIAMPMRVSQ
jgi:uncharacterized cupredoxin-like copper-binding protein